MAAKPPKPPGNFLKSLLNQHNNNKNQQQQQNNEDENLESNINNNCSEQFATIGTAATSTLSDTNTTTTSTIAPSVDITKKINCNCSNISIMHLFHEMKQEFPTIPDTIVAQCVNENCHQRENCIQMLRNELELHPIAAQSYPAKVLHPPNNNNNNNNNTQNLTNNNNNTNSIQKPPLQQKPQIVQQKPPLKPLKPIRTAPLQPPAVQSNNNNNNSAKINTAQSKNTTTTNKPLVAVGENFTNVDVSSSASGGGADGGVGDAHRGDVVETNTPPINSTPAEFNNNENICIGENNTESNSPRQRPTTLNLNTQLQKQQRQRLNIQLQQRFQEQRNRQLHLQQQPQNHANITKPIRKAPLPPIAPKPSQFPTNHHPIHSHTNNNANNNNSCLNDSLASNNTNTTSPLAESEISVSVSLSTPSPTSPNTTATHHHSLTNQQHQQQKQQQQKHLQTKSPIRHRSVITLQPEPPYTRDFLYTPPTSLTSSTPSSPSLAAPPGALATAIQTSASANSSSSATSSPTASVAGSQKSFTSVNLTLRPPVSPTSGATSALQPSTIDITAGPGFSGASGGGKSLHYSSTSYDARLGYQQNFQITVTDEGGVFSACRLRAPQQQQQQRCLNQQFHNNNVVALQQNIQNSLNSPYGIGGVNTNTSSGFGSGGVGSYSGNMCLPSQQAMDGPTQEILQRQKDKRDKLAAALREYKKRLGNVEQEINLLTGTIPTEGLSERLDEEITKLRRDCEEMLRSSATFPQPPAQAPTPQTPSTQQELAINYQPSPTPPQPFPRQRIPRPTHRPPAPPRQTSLDIIQHHSPSLTPHTTLPAASLPNLNSPLQQLQQQQQQYQQQHYLSTNSLNSNSSFHTPMQDHRELYTDHAYFGDTNQVDSAVDDDEYDEVEFEPWECNMCTFRNHPQLNICEACENVRILPEPVLSREDIHITLSPGENRIIHSWIVS